MKNKIIEANVAYREGHPIMSDAEFDSLCDEYRKTVSPEEWTAFRNTLHEKEGKVKHPFVMGSLDKVKLDDNKGLSDMILTKSISVSL